MPPGPDPKPPSKILARARMIARWLTQMGREYPFFVVPFALVLLLAAGLLAFTQGASYVAPFFYAIF